MYVYIYIYISSDVTDMLWDNLCMYVCLHIYIYIYSLSISCDIYNMSCMIYHVIPTSLPQKHVDQSVGLIQGE